MTSTRTFERFDYAFCYCEENVYKACERYKNKEIYAVFISSPKRKLPLWAQRLAKQANKPVIWDYHVILIEKRDGRSFVIDFDTNTIESCHERDTDDVRAVYPILFKDYVNATIHPEINLGSVDFERRFRVIPASLYLDHFASDRSHMLKQDFLDSASGLAEHKPDHYHMPPPKWPAICGPESAKRCISMNLDDYINMTPGEHGDKGDVYGQASFILLFK
ncbi:N-terminal glutamine amidase-domain-containing protein [Lipomyces arxii]|uniref:N-terminal glutamine amidase-domain-containing protein n=1 Tax=Lipomyces arxii TaxID=56418 RepID=UPI0034D01C22